MPTPPILQDCYEDQSFGIWTEFQLQTRCVTLGKILWSLNLSGPSENWINTLVFFVKEKLTFFFFFNIFFYFILFIFFFLILFYF